MSTTSFTPYYPRNHLLCGPCRLKDEINTVTVGYLTFYDPQESLGPIIAAHLPKEPAQSQAICWSCYGRHCFLDLLLKFQCKKYGGLEQNPIFSLHLWPDCPPALST